MEKLYICLFLTTFYLKICFGQIAFKEDAEMDKQRQNAAGRIPLYTPGKCNKNELLYPGDQKNDWICDCAPAHVFYPETDECYPAFRQGPCADKEILILAKNKIIPECIANPCMEDGKIPIHGVCYKLGTAGPCPDPQLTNVIGVNATTLEITCVKLSVALNNRVDSDPNSDSALSSLNFEKIELCAPGTKRAIHGTCPSIV